MRKIILALLAMIMCTAILSACGSGDVEEPEVVMGTSEFFTEEEIKACMDVAEECFNGWSVKCNLRSIKYAGDEFSSEGLEYVNTLTGYSYEKCIVILTDFKTPKDAKGFDKNKLYKDWEWYIVKESDGEWVMFTNGQISEAFAK